MATVQPRRASLSSTTRQPAASRSTRMRPLRASSNLAHPPMLGAAEPAACVYQPSKGFQLKPTSFSHTSSQPGFTPAARLVPAKALAKVVRHASPSSSIPLSAFPKHATSFAPSNGGTFAAWHGTARTGGRASALVKSTSKVPPGCAASLPGGAASVATTAGAAAAAAAASPQGAQMLQEAHMSHGVQMFDFVVVGSGIAGLTYALKVAKHGRVAVVTKDEANEGATQYAQGGVCSVLDATDSVENHVHDTMVAGAFLNDLRAVEVVCSEGPARVLELVQLGAEFTRNKDGSLHLTREGGHSHRRIVHMADVTGREIERALLAAVRSHPNVRLFENHLALDLVTDEYNGQRHCLGLDALDLVSGRLVRFIGLATMLASGGAGQVYPNTTNPHVATGDGIAMAYRAKAAVANMEFVQFHPTALFTGQAGMRTPLISEAVRGEGGLLFNLNGERFMPRYDERLELAPRDIVARSIHDQMRLHDHPHVLLDISHKPRDMVLSHFPNIAATCRDHGIDITRDPIPVVPAQHYMCGGVLAGLNAESNVAGLFACGEVACSGLHGANRLASNSLLEGLVFAHRAVAPSLAHAEHVARHCSRQVATAAAAGLAREVRPLSAAAAAWVGRQRSRLRALMWRAAGIVRTTAELSAALDEVAGMYLEVKELYSYWGVDKDLAELRNLVTVAELVLSCALQRKESRGLHYVMEYPEAFEAERRASVISTSLKARYDLAVVAAQMAARRGGGGAAGAGVGGVGGAGAGAGGKLGGQLAGGSGSTLRGKQREMVVRSFMEEGGGNQFSA